MIGRALDEYHAAGFFKQFGIQMARRLNLVDEEQRPGRQRRCHTVDFGEAHAGARGVVYTSSHI